MNINEAREIVAKADTERAQSWHGIASIPRYKEAKAFIEAYEQFEPLAKALEDIEDMNPGDFDVTHAAWIAREALKTFREGQK